ncbi:peptidase family M28 [Diplocarpon rosae]|nr:peptidase family M28 [Diplocarpon rosae]
MMRFSSILPAFVTSLSLVAGWPNLITSYPGMQKMFEVENLTPKATTIRPWTWINLLTKFHNRDYRSSYGLKAGEWLYERIKEVTEPNSLIKTTVFQHKFNQPSFIVRIPGKVKYGKISEKIVVVSTYYDSTAGSEEALAPGAVDNASTVAALLEALAVLSQAKYETQHNIEFHFYGGSKGGRLGSQDVMDKYIKEKKDVIALLHQVGYSRKKQINVYKDYSNPALVNYVSAIATKYFGSVDNFGVCGAKCNDHISAHERGYAYVTGETFDRDYFDTPRDEFKAVDIKAVERHARFTIAFVAEAGYV